MVTLPCPLHQGLDVSQSYLQSPIAPLSDLLCLCFYRENPSALGPNKGTATQQGGAGLPSWAQGGPGPEAWEWRVLGRVEGSSRQVGEPGAAQPSPGREVTEQAVGGGGEAHVIECCATGASGKQLTKPPWSQPLPQGHPPSYPPSYFSFRPEGAGSLP